MPAEVLHDNVLSRNGSCLTSWLCRPGAAGGSSCSGAAAGQPSGGVAAAKSLAALPEEGAMRPLVESLLEGRWASGQFLPELFQQEAGFPLPCLLLQAPAQ